jgi:hypothetical protein
MLQKSQPTLEEVQQLFEQWRRTKRRRDRIPQLLWEAAVSLSGQHSTHRISKLLHLNHTDVSDRIRAHKEGDGVQRPHESAFIELDVIPSATVSEWAIEMERPDGGRMKICLKGSSIDAAELSKAFWMRT